MPRSRRRPSEHDWHHVLNRGVDRSSVFFEDRDRIDFLAVLAEASVQSGAEVHAYCLMTNHYHLLVRASLASLAATMHQLGTTYTRHVNDRRERDGPLFRGRFQSVPIADDRQLLRCLRYIHRNPTAIVGPDSLDTYRWSSHRLYLGHRWVPDWLHVDELLGRFDDRARYRAFVTVCEPVSTVSLDDVHHAVAATWCEFDGIRPGESLVRGVSLLLAERHPRVAGHLAGQLDFPSGNARYAAHTRARRRLRFDDEFRALLCRVEATFHLGSDPE